MSRSPEQHRGLESFSTTGINKRRGRRFSNCRLAQSPQVQVVHPAQVLLGPLDPDMVEEIQRRAGPAPLPDSVVQSIQRMMSDKGPTSEKKRGGSRPNMVKRAMNNLRK